MESERATLLQWARFQEGARRIAEHRAILLRLEEVAESYAARGMFDDAVSTVEAAGRVALYHHPGTLASPRLETVLERAATSLPPLVREPHGDEKQRVLIVATEMYGVGGHTRAIWRWVARDPSRTYSVVSTASGISAPEGVRQAVEASGGVLVEISTQMPPLARAARVRELVAAADTVVLVNHSFDPIPAVALGATEERPPVVLMDHAGHFMWFGRNVVDLVTCNRELGITLARRRGFPESRIVVMPAAVSGPDGHGRALSEPVDVAEREHARSQILGRLGWPRDIILAVTVGASYKYKSFPGNEFLDFVGPVLASTPGVGLLAIGPEHDERWMRLAIATGGRAAALGSQPKGVGVALAAADIFLESLPFGGLGAADEAASYGVPVLSGAATQPEADCFAVAYYGGIRRIGIPAYQEALEELISNEAMRRELGESGRVELSAADRAWPAAVERLYAAAHSTGRLDQAELDAPPEAGDIDLVIETWDRSRRHDLTKIELGVTMRELIARQPSLRRLVGPLEGPEIAGLGLPGIGFATPSVDAASLRALVSEFHLMLRFGLASKFEIALTPDAAAVAIPLLETILEGVPELDIELTIDRDPDSTRPHGAMDISVE